MIHTVFVTGNDEVLVVGEDDIYDCYDDGDGGTIIELYDGSALNAAYDVDIFKRMMSGEKVF